MQKILIACSLLGLLATAPATSPAWAEAGLLTEPLKVPGTRVFLSPPQGFAAADQFSGFVKKDINASLVVTEIPGPYDQVVSSFSKGELATKGMNLTASSIITIGKAPGSQASLIEFTQSASGKKFKKVAYIFGDQTTTIMITGTMPDNGSESLFESLRTAVKSARVDARAKLAGLDEGLPFTIADTKKFKKATRLQNTLLFTTSGKALAGKDNGALFVVGQSAGDIAVGYRETFARERLEHSAQVNNIRIENTTKIKQAGLDGEEFLARATDAEDGAPTFVFHTMLFDKNSYFIFQGICPLCERPAYEPEYQKLVKNFQLR